MRLLHYNQYSRLVLTDFTGKTIPPYAILSHRWTGSEVLFEDLGNNTYENKLGYRKITFCAKQAAKDQLQHFWIDTCCIDKWNLDELSKSINSMFYWYKGATKCYAYLADVTVPTEAQTSQHSTWEASFRKSEWFTRGWTLQELIAPVSVEFFSLEGWRLGDKATLEQLLHEITSLPLQALQNGSLNEFTTSERISWAQNRRTTEKEDNVYCLLGILGISMPADYGEGEERALKRLMIEIDANRSAPSIIPFSQNNRFVGRELQLVDLETALFSGEQSTRIAIVGHKGIGKSQLVLEFAYITREKKKNCSVFWIDASNIESLSKAYFSIARKLNVSGWDHEKADIKKLVQAHLSNEDTRETLLIFDNADRVHFVSTRTSTAPIANLLDYLPRSRLCSVVLTTTELEISEKLALEKIIELQEMTADSAQRMLELHLNTPASTEDQQEMEDLVEELSYLPLAIVHASAYINTRNIMLKDYRRRFVKEKEEALGRDGEQSEGKLHDCGQYGPVVTTLRVSLDQVRRDNPIAACYLFLAACVDQKDIPLDFLETSSSYERDEAISTLNSYRLITRRPAESALDLHQLVHQAIREWLREQGWIDKWTQKSIAQLLEIFPDPRYGNRSKWRRLMSHTRYALSHHIISPGDGDRMTLKWKYALALEYDGRYKEAEELLLQVVEMRKHILGDEHEDTLVSMEHLASIYELQDRWSETEEIEMQIMKTRMKVFQEGHPATLASMEKLASTYQKQGQLDEAERLKMLILETRKKRLSSDEDYPSRLVSLTHLAASYRMQGWYNEAESLDLEVTEACKLLLGEDHLHTLGSMLSLAFTYLGQERWTEAEMLLIPVTEKYRATLGEDHPLTLQSLILQGMIYFSLQQWKEAEKLLLKVIKMGKAKLGEHHSLIVKSKMNLCSVYSHQGRYEEAEKLAEEVLDICKKKFSKDHPDVLNSMNRLAEGYYDNCEIGKAERLLAQVLEIRRAKFGNSHPSTLNTLHNLAIIWNEQSRQTEAIYLMRECVEGRNRILGASHPSSIASSSALDKWESQRGQDNGGS